MIEAAKILQRRLPYRVPGKCMVCFVYTSLKLSGQLRVTEWAFEVPLSYDKPSESIRLFARSAEKVDSSIPGLQADQSAQQKPWRAYINPPTLLL